MEDDDIYMSRGEIRLRNGSVLTAHNGERIVVGEEVASYTFGGDVDGGMFHTAAENAEAVTEAVKRTTEAIAQLRDALTCKFGGAPGECKCPA